MKYKTRGYDKEFKLNAVNLFLSKDLSYRQLSEELDVPTSTLSGWVNQHQKDGNEAFPGKGHLKPTDAELAQLRKELAIAREERDILKKALGIFSKTRK